MLIGQQPPLLGLRADPLEERARNIAAYVPAEFISPQLELVIVLPK